MRVTASAWRLGITFAGLLVLACDSTSPSGSFAISLSEASASVAQGGSRAVTVSIARTNFGNPVTFTVDGVPTGVTATFSPSPASGESSILQLTVANGAAPATSTLTVRANAEGAAEQTASYDLTVTVAGSFTLAALDAPLTVAQGGGGNTTVLVNRVGGFSGVVDVSVTGAPSGMTATLGSASTSSNGISLTIGASASVAAGTYNLTATGVSAGLPDQQATIAVNVIAPPATASLTVAFCANGMPDWFAYQNEGSAWQVASPSGNSFTFAATDRVAVASVFLSGDDKQVNIAYALRSEIAQQTARDCIGTKTVSGSVSGLTTGQTARVVLGSSGASPSPTASSPTWSMANVADEPLDLIATSGTVTQSVFTPDKMIVCRSIHPAGGSTVPALDFAASEAFTLQQGTVTIDGATTADQKTLINTFWSATSTFGAVQVATPATSSAVYFGVPLAQQVAGDVHELYLDAYQGAASVGRSMLSYFTAPGDRTETIGGFVNVPSIAVLTRTPYVRFRGRVESQTDYGSAVRFGYYQEPSPTDSRLVYVQVTAGYRGGTPTLWDVVIPDLSALAGFVTSWMPTLGETTTWQLVGFGGRSELLFTAMPVAGDVLRFSDRQGELASGNVRIVSSRGRLPVRQYFRR